MSSQLGPILWACRRGMLELDLVLTPFARDCWDSLSVQEQDDFEQLLTYHDQDLYQWILGEQAPESTSLKRMIDRVRTHACRSL